jgi:cytochrome c-type biogenesis protein CcmH
MKAMFNSNPTRITKHQLLLAALFALSVVFITSLTVHAQGPTPTDDEVNRIAKKLYCPVCENTPLDVCPTEACRQWREQIRQMLAEGKSEDEIIQYFIVTYGVRASGDPPNKLASYLVPAVAILLGVVILIRGFQMWMKPSKTEAGRAGIEAQPVQDEYFAILEEELKKRK